MASFLLIGSVFDSPLASRFSAIFTSFIRVRVLSVRSVEWLADDEV